MQSSSSSFPVVGNHLLVQDRQLDAPRTGDSSNLNTNNASAVVDEISPGSASDHMGGPFPRHRSLGCEDAATSSSGSITAAAPEAMYPKEQVAYDIAPSWKHVEVMELSQHGADQAPPGLSSAPAYAAEASVVWAPQAPFRDQQPEQAQIDHESSSTQVPRVVSTLLSASDSNNDVTMDLNDSAHAPFPQPVEVVASNASVAMIISSSPVNDGTTPSPAPTPSSSPKGKKTGITGSSSSSLLLSSVTSPPTKPTVRRGRATQAKLTRNNSLLSTATMDSGSFHDGDAEDDLEEDFPAHKSSSTSKNPLQRRQKRLERNRESARLSRRRRKQYLEVLEERVTKFSHEMDKGRREHVAACLSTIQDKRSQVIQQANQEVQQMPSPPILSLHVQMLERNLSRCSQELMVTSTFRSQQLKSFVLPPSTKFIMWLTLQTDAYFRGGRAASERLSAARIGDRLLNSGTDRVTPCESMWPLFCSEVGLSYEQEEKVRNYQRVLLQTPETWVDRHISFAMSKTLESAHDAVQAVTLRFGQRERTNLSFLTDEQKIKYLAWADQNRERIAHVSANANKRTTMIDERYKLDDSQHTAANFYVLNHRFQTVMKRIPLAAPLVTGILLRKLSRRPSFESLGSAEGRKDSMSRSDSCASMSSMKRDASEGSMEGSNADDGERPHVPPVSPSEAQATFQSVVDEKLGSFKEIIPPPPSAVSYGSSTSASSPFFFPAPTPVSEMMRPAVQQVVPVQAMPQPLLSYQPSYQPAIYSGTYQPFAAMPPAAAPVALGVPDPTADYLQQPQASALEQPHHHRPGSFLPPHLNVVPEEMWPDDAADDFLMKLVDEDWAIGEGIDMETDLQATNK